MPTDLPRWDLSDVFTGLDDRRLADAVDLLAADVARAAATFDRHGIGAQPPREASVADGAAAEEALDLLNRAMDASRLVRVYVHAAVTTDSRDPRAQRLAARMAEVEAGLRPLQARLAEWVAALGSESLAAVSAAAADHAGVLRRLEARAVHQMPADQEALHAALTTTGAMAWARLHGELTSQLEGVLDGERLPVTVLRGMASDPDPVVRRAAHDAERDAWPAVRVPLAAALNAIKGEAITVGRRRGWDDPLDASLFANNVERPAFEAMLAAVDGALGDLRRFLRTKAGLHGHDGGLPWWDLVAPLPVGPRTVAWEEGVARVRAAFGSYGGDLRDLLDRALAERWIDAAPRAGKRGGAFCSSLAGDRSIVFLNWSGSLDATRTLAHELGHAFHNTRLATRPALQRLVPMALAETASIFCETLLVEATLATTDDPAERLALVDVNLCGTTQVVVDILSRLRFEAAVFERRRHGSVSADELDALMLDAQEEAYGDGLDLATRHPHMWAVKPHYYAYDFYNWPYTFGLLLGTGLFVRFREDPAAFRAGYDDLLSRVGTATAAELAAGFGFDLADQGFWEGALDVVRARVDEHARLSARLGERTPRPARPAEAASSLRGVASRYDLTRDDIAARLGGEPAYRVRQVWQGLYEQLAEPGELTTLPKELRSRLDRELPPGLAAVTERVSEGGDTVKALWRLDGGALVESVLMLYPDRATVCVSTQAGCAMGCGFCATGQAGFERHLGVGEIVEQVVRAARRARDLGRRLSNVVFMGMGEPLANYDGTWGAVRRIHEDLGLSARHLTVSTVGIVPGIRRLAGEELPVNLAVSLHAADDALRDELVPINRRYPLAVLMGACGEYLRAKGRRLSFEWALIDGVNDRPADAARLAALCRDLPLAAHVNLIPLNPTPGYPTTGTPPPGVRAFRDRLVELGVNATVRRNRGTEIDAACGQLAAGQPVRLGSGRRSPAVSSAPAPSGTG